MEVFSRLPWARGLKPDWEEWNVIPGTSRLPWARGLKPPTGDTGFHVLPSRLPWARGLKQREMAGSK